MEEDGEAQYNVHFTPDRETQDIQVTHKDRKESNSKILGKEETASRKTRHLQEDGEAEIAVPFRKSEY